MKALRHPNIVKLVGICWDDSLFACCLEFVPNGSLEDWLRRTAGGKSYDPSKQKKKKSKKKKGAADIKDDAPTSLADVCYGGYDMETHSETMHTSTDLAKVDEMLAKVDAFASECATPASASSHKWTTALNADGSALPFNVEGYGRYSSATHFGESFARARINAQPSQVFGLYRDLRWSGSETLSEIETLEKTAATQLDYLNLPQAIPGVSDRELLMKCVFKAFDDGSFVDVTYSCEDERKPIRPGVVRMLTLFILCARPLPGNDGSCEVIQITLLDPCFKGALLSSLNAIVGKQLVDNNALPLAKLKRDVEVFMNDNSIVHQERCKRIFDGFDHTGEYDEALHTKEDKQQVASMISKMEKIRKSCRDWTPLLTDSGTPFPHSVKGWCQFNHETKWGESLAILPQVNASPSQVFAKYTEKLDSTRDTEETSRIKIIYEDFTTRLEFIPVPMPSLLHDREMLYRGVYKKLEDGGFMHISYSVEDERRKPKAGSKRMVINFAEWVRALEGSDGKASQVWRCVLVQPNFGKITGSVLNSMVTKKSAANTAGPLVLLKETTELLLAEYEPPLAVGASGVQSLTWRGQLLGIATQCALGVQYLHQERYWAEEEVKEGGEVVAAGYRECIIHRDLKPDNMLLTKDWQLKLTDFGEARAINLNQTMTSVGTPIYVAPEVMAGYSYDSTADSYSYGICLVAMIRGEKDIMEFYFQALRKTMERKTKKGVGITILNNRMYGKGWRPLLPLEFEKSYPKMCKLLKRCWAQKKEDRPSFDDIVMCMQGEIAAEVRGKEEPVIVMYGDEDDLLYRGRMGKDEVLDDSDENEGENDTRVVISKRAMDEVLKEMVSKKAMEEVVEGKELVIEEMREKFRVLEEELRAVRRERTTAGTAAQEAEMSGMMNMLGR